MKLDDRVRPARLGVLLVLLTQCSKRLKPSSPRRLMFLGDILYHGPRNDLPREYAPEAGDREAHAARKIELLCVRGNCDCEVDQMVLPVPGARGLWLSCWLECGRRGLSDARTRHQQRRIRCRSPRGDILLHGHTHVPACEDCGDFTLSEPRLGVHSEGNDSRHSYMIYEDGAFSWKNLETGETYRTFSIS